LTHRWIMILLAIAATFFVPRAAANKKSDALRASLNSEFMGNPFETKIPLGSYWVYFDTNFQTNCTRLIDTEFEPDGSTRYLARYGCLEGLSFTGPSASYVGLDVITLVQKPGTRVWVRKIDLKDNRIEFELRIDPNSNSAASYAKIKFMFGKDYQDKDYNALRMVIAHALRVEALERLLMLDSEFSELKEKLPALEAAYRSASGPTGAKLEAARRLRNVLNELSRNRNAYVFAGGQIPDKSDCSSRSQTLDREIAALELEQRKEEIGTLQDELQANISESGQAKVVLQGTLLATPAELQKFADALARYRQLLQERDSLYSRLESAGNAVPGSGRDELLQENQEANGYAEALESARPHVQRAGLNSEYREMLRRRSQLLDAYTRAFGTSEERHALQALITHLKRMTENRKDAAKLGDANAEREAVQNEREIEKLSKRL